jgi:hypothetical protein
MMVARPFKAGAGFPVRRGATPEAAIQPSRRDTPFLNPNPQ